MKLTIRKSLLPFLLISAAGVINHTSAQGWSIGDKAYIGHGWMVGNRPNDDNVKYAFHPSVQVGRNAVYNFNPSVGLGIGTFFSTEGGSFKNKDADPDIRIEQRMNYIRVPLFANFNFGDPAAKVRGHLALGGSVGFLVGGKTFIETDRDAIAGRKTRKALDTKVDAGATATLGFSVKLADGFVLNHDVNYYHGLVEQKYDGALTGLGAPTFTTRNIGLSLGFLIDGNAMKKWKQNMHGKHQR